jgi:hypothetical protein
MVDFPFGVVVTTFLMGSGGMRLSCCFIVCCLVLLVNRASVSIRLSMQPMNGP